MNLNFILLCSIIITLALLTTYGLAPILWDAAGAIETMLNTIYHVEFSVVSP